MKVRGAVAHVPKIHLPAAAGGAGGCWYVLMAGLASLVAETHPQIRIEVARVGAGEIPMGILR